MGTTSTHYGVYSYVSGNGNMTVNVTSSTFHANGTSGTDIYAGSDTGSIANLNVKNTHVTNQGYGVYRPSGLVPCQTACYAPNLMYKPDLFAKHTLASRSGPRTNGAAS